MQYIIYLSKKISLCNLFDEVAYVETNNEKCTIEVNIQSQQQEKL